MDIRLVLKSQYHAALKTLKAAIETCPDVMWADPADEAPAFWRVAYHTLFFAHFYLQQNKDVFKRWERHRAEAEMFAVPWENFRAPKPCGPYTKADLLEYWAIVDGAIDAGVDKLDLETAQCGFPWYKMGTLEHQIVNIRHIQHHAAILSGRLRREARIGIDWVGKG